MRLKLISCDVFYREVRAAVSRSANTVDVEFLPIALHDDASRMRDQLQQAADAAADTPYDAIAFAYGLCGNGIAALEAKRVPFVFPRSHDCIGLFLGSRARYLDYFTAHPGTYFRTSGWLERVENPDSLNQLSLGSKLALPSREELVAKYGEDNAGYLLEVLGDPARHYRRLAFIAMGVEPDGSLVQRAREEAQRRGWVFENVPGDMALLQNLVDGNWSEDDFLVLRPGQRLRGAYDDRIIEAEP